MSEHAIHPTFFATIALVELPISVEALYQFFRDAYVYAEEPLPHKFLKDLLELHTEDGLMTPAVHDYCVAILTGELEVYYGS